MANVQEYKKKIVNDMTKLMKLSHTEVEVKLFLEVLGVYAVLASVLVGIYYLEPVITGFATADQLVDIRLSNSMTDEKNWVVSFYTVGTGDLGISMVDGSYSEMYNDDSSSIDDLRILELKCGEYEIFNIDNLIDTERVWFILLDNSRIRLSEVVWSSVPVKGVYVEDYSCDDETGHYTVEVLEEGKFIQELKFGEKVISVTN